MPLQIVNNNNSGLISLENVSGIGSLLLYSQTSTITPTTGSPWQQIDTITSYLRNYVSDFRNPFFFTYRLDGNSFQILDLQI